MKRPIIDETKPYDPYDPYGTYDGGTVDKKKKRQEMLVWLVAMLFCSIFVIIAVVMYLGDMKRKGECTEKLTAVVCENRPRESSNGGYTYQPVFEYVYNDHKYIVASNTSSSPAKFSEGEEVELYIDPDEPTKIYVPSDNVLFILCCVFGGIGGVSMLIATIVFICVCKNRNKPDEELVDMKYY